jgi:hypothetical protein
MATAVNAHRSIVRLEAARVRRRGRGGVRHKTVHLEDGAASEARTYTRTCTLHIIIILIEREKEPIGRGRADAAYQILVQYQRPVGHNSRLSKTKY